MLDRAKIKYEVLEYDCDESDLSGVHAAAALSLDPKQVFKTLVTRGGKSGLFVFCIPVGAELDLKKSAKCAGVKSLEMIHVKELISLTGYMRGRLLADRHEKAVSDVYRLDRSRLRKDICQRRSARTSALPQSEGACRFCQSGFLRCHCRLTL